MTCSDHFGQNLLASFTPTSSPTSLPLASPGLPRPIFGTSQTSQDTEGRPSRHRFGHPNRPEGSDELRRAETFDAPGARRRFARGAQWDRSGGRCGSAAAVWSWLQPDWKEWKYESFLHGWSCMNLWNFATCLPTMEQHSSEDGYETPQSSRCECMSPWFTLGRMVQEVRRSFEAAAVLTYLYIAYS